MVYCENEGQNVIIMVTASCHTRILIASHAVAHLA